jgi:hypothetical protein
MTGLSEQDVSWLTTTNWILGIACAALVLAVLGGVVWERVARWMLRAQLPDCWPPEPPPPPATRGRRSHPVARAHR